MSGDCPDSHGQYAIVTKENYVNLKDGGCLEPY